MMSKGLSLSVSSGSAGFPDCIRFSHKAMATIFEIYICKTEEFKARGAVQAALGEIDRLEQLLSRFISGSDISRINELHPGRSIVISPETMECLQTARQVWKITEGAFDVTYLGMKGEFGETGWNRLLIDTEALAISVKGKPVEIDLGGIGKGFAVDYVAEIMKEWWIERFLIHSGSSSIRAGKPPENHKGWTIALTNSVSIELCEESLSCSAQASGRSFANPVKQLVDNHYVAWVKGPNAAICDAISTAAIVMGSKEMERFSKVCPEFTLVVSDADSGKSEDFGGMV